MASERFVRWQNRTIEQLGYALNLLLGLSVGSLGFCLAMLTSESFQPHGLAKGLFTSALLLLLLSSVLGIVCVITRLNDFRLTKDVVKIFEKHPESHLLPELRQKTAELGRNTWIFFRWQVRVFGAAIILLTAAFIAINFDKLF